MQIFWLGLILIILSWVVQVVYTLMRDKKMIWLFPLLQFLGILFLVLDMYKTASELDSTFYLQIGSGVGAIAMLLCLIFKKK